jgi:hypothetical protein
MNRLTAGALSLVLSGGVLAGCSVGGTGLNADPCSQLPRASQADIARANQGEEIEQDVQVGTKVEKKKDPKTGKIKKKNVPVYEECDLVQGKWELDED